MHGATKLIGPPCSGQCPGSNHAPYVHFEKVRKVQVIFGHLKIHVLGVDSNRFRGAEDDAVFGFVLRCREVTQKSTFQGSKMVGKWT
jgi:hypothetical protein